jgi:hypothetical protein
MPHAGFAGVSSGHACITARRAVRAALRSPSSARSGEIEGNHRAAAGVVTRVNVAAVKASVLSGDRQAQSTARRTCPRPQDTGYRGMFRTDGLRRGAARPGGPAGPRRGAARARRFGPDEMLRPRANPSVQTEGTDACPDCSGSDGLRLDPCASAVDGNCPCAYGVRQPGHRSRR